MQVTATSQPIVLLRGASVRSTDTLEELATLGIRRQLANP
jgi:hypothetical protein